MTRLFMFMFMFMFMFSSNDKQAPAAVSVWYCLVGISLLLNGDPCDGWSRPPHWRARRTLVQFPTLKAGRDDPPSSRQLVSGLLRVSYDGAHFTGWSAANQENSSTSTNSTASQSSRRLSGRNIRRARRSGVYSYSHGGVRSVEHVLQTNLAKLFGNVPVSKIVVEGCSRTDKGVHAQCMVAQFYALSDGYEAILLSDASSQSIPRKRKPHPVSSYDASRCFMPMSMSLAKLMYCLNRMLPHDVKVRAVATLPCKSNSDRLPFHPTLDTRSKTYRYTFSLGPALDPLSWRTVWHLDSTCCTLPAHFRVDEVQRVAHDLLIGTHDFAAFRGAPRGKDDKRRQQTESTICTMHNLTVFERPVSSSFEPTLSIYTLSVTGDRFLYKMMRFLVGALVALGAGTLSEYDIKQALKKGSWKVDGGKRQFTCAPAHALVLTNVTYAQPIEWIVACKSRQSTYDKESPKD